MFFFNTTFRNARDGKGYGVCITLDTPEFYSRLNEYLAIYVAGQFDSQVYNLRFFFFCFL